MGHGIIVCVDVAVAAAAACAELITDAAPAVRPTVIVPVPHLY